FLVEHTGLGAAAVDEAGLRVVDLDRAGGHIAAGVTIVGSHDRQLGVGRGGRVGLQQVRTGVVGAADVVGELRLQRSDFRLDLGAVLGASRLGEQNLFLDAVDD